MPAIQENDNDLLTRMFFRMSKYVLKKERKKKRMESKPSFSFIPFTNRNRRARCKRQTRDRRKGLEC